MTHEDEIIQEVADLAEKVAIRALEWLLMVMIPTIIVYGAWLILHGRDMLLAVIAIYFAMELITPLRILRKL